MRHLRLATNEEIQKIQKGADLVEGCRVLALENRPGDPDLAVLRTVIEMDPVIFSPNSNDRDKYKFIFALEERMMGLGVPQYYFNISAKDTHWQKIIEAWGGERVSATEEFRYVKGLK
jgi:hypothetical protein